MERNAFIFAGRLVHSIDLQQLEFLETGVLVVDEGKIQVIEKTFDNLEKLKILYNIPDNKVYKLKTGQFVIPGLIDTHIHAPQYPNVGLGNDLPLLQWLEKYTYPLEKQYWQTDFARKVYEAVVRQTLSQGTTTSCYFATIHEDTSLILADVASQFNQRAFVGKVNMTTRYPKGYGETMSESIVKTESFLKALQNNEIVKPIITPRFALSCDMTTMKQLAELSRQYDAHIQTHISENKEEIEAVLSVFPECKSYADVYDKAGLLTNKTILAHGVYLSDEEIELIKSRGSSIAHCPNSNMNLQSGLCPVRYLLSSGLQVGLGTDCSGGYSASMLDSIRCAINTSVCVSFNNENLKRLTTAEAFYLATLGGAKALALADKVGNFVVGKEFDALLVDVGANASLDLLQEYTFEQLFQKFIYLGDSRNILDIYVRGRKCIRN